MFEDIEGKDAIEAGVAKGQGVRVADHVGVAKNLVFQFDAAGIFPRARAGAEMQDALVAPRENFLKLGADRVAGVRGRNGDDSVGVGQEDWDSIHDRELRAAILATQRARSVRQHVPADGTGKKSREIGVHVARLLNF